MAGAGLQEDDMPTTRRRLNRTLRNADGISEADYVYFTWGDFFEAQGYKEGKAEAELKTFWRAHRQAIMDRYFREGRHAGQRPWPFWEWEMPEPRLKVGTHEYWGPWTKDGPPKEPEILDVFEDDEVYLRRVGLLENWELEKLKILGVRQQQKNRGKEQ